MRIRSQDLTLWKILISKYLYKYYFLLKKFVGKSANLYFTPSFLMENTKTIKLLTILVTIIFFSQYIVIPYFQRLKNSHLVNHDGGWNIDSISYVILFAILSISAIVKFKTSTNNQKCIRIAMLIVTAYFCWVLKNQVCEGCAMCG